MVRTFSAAGKVPTRGGHRRRCLIVQDPGGEVWLLVARRGTALTAGKYATEALLALAQWNGVLDKGVIVLKPSTTAHSKQGYVLVAEDDGQLAKLVTALA